MDMPKIYYYILAILVLFSMGVRCGSPTGTSLDPEEFTPAFLFASNEGEVRILNIDVDENGENVYTVTRFSSIGRTSAYGRINTDADFAMDWTFPEGSNDPRLALSLVQENPSFNPALGPQREFIYQTVSVNENTRINELFYTSPATGFREKMEHFNQNSGANSYAVDFTNDSEFISLYVDRLDEPSDPDPFRALGLLLNFSYQQDINFNGNTIIPFNVVLAENEIPVSQPLTNAPLAKVSSSANGEFIYVWASVTNNNFTRTPYAVRRNGTLALNPKDFSTKDYRNRPGVIINQLEPHPTRDSVVAVVDYSSSYANGEAVNGFHVLRLGLSENEWFTPLHFLPSEEVTGQNMLLSGELRGQRNMYISYSPLGDRIAILYALPSSGSSLVIWYPEEDRTERIQIDPSTNITDVRMPAWYYQDSSILLFTAGNNDAGYANFYVVDTDDNNGTARRIDWDDDIDRSTVLDQNEVLTEVREVVGRPVRN